MTKQQIVAQLAAAKLIQSGRLPHVDFLEHCGSMADKIIEMFPEPDYTVAGNPLTVSVAGWGADFDKCMEGVVHA